MFDNSAFRYFCVKVLSRTVHEASVSLDVEWCELFWMLQQDVGRREVVAQIHKINIIPLEMKLRVHKLTKIYDGL